MNVNERGIKPNAKNWLRLVWNLIISVAVIAVTAVILKCAFAEIDANFLVGTFLPNDVAYIICLCLLTSALMAVATAFNIINIIKGNFALQQGKAFAMKHLHIALLIFGVVSLALATMLPSGDLGVKIFIGILFITTIRELVYQAMLFVDNYNKEIKAKGNAICLIYSSLGSLVCSVLSLHLISLIGAIPWVYQLTDFNSSFKTLHYSLDASKIGWLIIVAVLLSVFIVLFVFSLLKAIKKNKVI